MLYVLSCTTHLQPSNMPLSFNVPHRHHPSPHHPATLPTNAANSQLPIGTCQHHSSHHYPARAQLYSTYCCLLSTIHVGHPPHHLNLQPNLTLHLALPCFFDSAPLFHPLYRTWTSLAAHRATPSWPIPTTNWPPHFIHIIYNCV